MYVFNILICVSAIVITLINNDKFEFSVMIDRSIVLHNLINIKVYGLQKLIFQLSELKYSTTFRTRKFFLL